MLHRHWVNRFSFPMVSSHPLRSANVLLCINDIVTTFICGRGRETDKFSDLFYKFLGEGLGVV